MIRDYMNEKIERNAKICKILSIISMVLSLITLITYICVRASTDKNPLRFHFYCMLILIPITAFYFVSKVNGITISKLLNPRTFYITSIVISFLPYVMLILLSIAYSAVGLIGNDWAYYCGYMLPSHIWLYIADCFLIYSCVLIKKEWKKNPPDFISEKNERIKLKKEEQQNAKNTVQYKEYICKCGIRFFIKYYNQIKRLPLRDVVISENYSAAEREERLMAAKQIIDLNLTEFALCEIIRSYSDVLDKAELEQAESILADLKNNNQ